MNIRNDGGPIECKRGNVQFSHLAVDIDVISFVRARNGKYKWQEGDSKTGETGLQWAALHGNVSLVQFFVRLIELKKTDKKILDLASIEDRYTALDCTQQGIQSGMSERQAKNSLACAKLLLQAGADPTISIHPSINPLDWAEENPKAFYAKDLAELYITYKSQGNREGPFVRGIRIEMAWPIIRELCWAFKSRDTCFYELHPELIAMLIEKITGSS